jgi:hypothetical protein
LQQLEAQMKRLFKFCAFVLMTLTISSAALARSNSVVDDLGIIDLKSNAASLKFDYNYPGINGPNGFDAPDCLMFVSSGVWTQLPEDALAKLAAGLKLTDGSGNMFPGGDINPLTPVLTDRSLVYYIVDLSKFVTGIEVSTQNGASLKALVKSVFGVNYPHFVGLQVVRSCRLVPQ